MSGFRAQGRNSTLNLIAPDENADQLSLLYFVDTLTTTNENSQKKDEINKKKLCSSYQVGQQARMTELKRKYEIAW